MFVPEPHYTLLQSVESIGMESVQLFRYSFSIHVFDRQGKGYYLLKEAKITAYFSYVYTYVALVELD